MTASYDVIVAGGGPIGAACARELALGGRRVAVLEPGGEMGQAWRAAAGMLAPQIETSGDTPLLELGLAGRELYSELAPQLRETTGSPGLPRLTPRPPISARSSPGSDSMPT